MSPVGSSTGGVQNPSGRGPLPPPSRRKTNTGPPGGGHHEKKKKGEAGLAGASDRGTGVEHDTELCRAGLTATAWRSQRRKLNPCQRQRYNAGGCHGRGKIPDRSVILRLGRMPE